MMIRVNYLMQRWILACAAAETAGLVFAAAVVFGLFHTLGEPRSGIAGSVFVTVLLVTGLVEGAILGASQARVLKRFLPTIRSADWILATMAGVGVIWVTRLLAPTFAAAFLKIVQLDADLTAAQWMLYSLPLGVLAGALLGLAQLFILRRHVANPAGWVAANALAWSIAIGPVLVAADFLSTTVGFLSYLGSAAFAGVISGTVLGVVTGLFLPALQRRLLVHIDEVPQRARRTAIH